MTLFGGARKISQADLGNHVSILFYAIDSANGDWTGEAL